MKRATEYLRSEKPDELLLLILAFIIPVFPKLVPLLIVLWLISVLILKRRELCLRYYKTIAFLLPSVLLIFYVTSLLYSDNISYGLKDIETKISLILFPLMSAFLIERQVKESYKITFVYGCLAMALYCFIYAALSYYQEMQDIRNHISREQYFSYDFFISSKLSQFLHPSYLSLYCCFAISILFERIIQGQNLSFSLVSYIFLLFFIVLLGSRAGLFCLFLILLIHIIRLFFNTQIKIGVSILVSIILTFLVVFKTSETFRIRFNIGIKAILNSSEINTSEFSRYSIWSSAKEVFSDNKLIGVGAGDVKDELIAQYLTDGKAQLYEKKLNAHSQFLQTGVAIGILGLIILLSLFGYGLYLSILNKDWVLGSFLVLSFLNFLVESMLETQAGVIFFSFFYSLLIIKYIKFGRIESKSFTFDK